MKLPTIGTLRQRLTLESANRTSDGGGGADVSWTFVAELWAAVRAHSGTESLSAEKLAGRVTHEVWIRQRDAVVPAMRFRSGSRTFHILAVLAGDEHGRRLRCLCEERDL